LCPVPPTAAYLNYVLSRLTAAGSVYLAAIALLPLVALGALHVSSQLAFSGTSLLIVVGVGLDTVKQIESQLHQHSYQGFVRQPVNKSADKPVNKSADKPAQKILESEGTPGRSAALNVS
jgi:hypothetical protein